MHPHAFPLRLSYKWPTEHSFETTYLRDMKNLYHFKFCLINRRGRCKRAQSCPWDKRIPYMIFRILERLSGLVVDIPKVKRGLTCKNEAK